MEGEAKVLVWNLSKKRDADEEATIYNFNHK